MVQRKTLKSVILAAASLAAIGAAVPAAAAAPMEPLAVEIVHAADHADADARAADKAVNRWLLGGAAAAALAGLIRLFGWTRISAAMRKAGAAAVAAPVAAAHYVGTALKSPFRSLVLVAGLSLFALTGIGFYDVEWAAGLLTGAVLTGLALIGARRFAKVFARR
ncbi:MAG TPA: hypothetical protein DEA50_06610 [Parvularcula sp.]|nr:hypothetical protein [Parvularcula sp.]